MIVGMATLEERKTFLLERVRLLGRPIWVGDVATNAIEQESYRAAFRALAEERKLVQRPGPKGGRAYYYFD